MPTVLPFEPNVHVGTGSAFLVENRSPALYKSIMPTVLFEPNLHVGTGSAFLDLALFWSDPEVTVSFKGKKLLNYQKVL
jgi:hypothetical protein